MNNYIKEYIFLLNNKKNILNIFHEDISFKIINNEFSESNTKKSIQELINSLQEEEKNENKILIQYYDNDNENKYLRLFPSLQLHRLYELLKEEVFDRIRYIFSPYLNNEITNYKPIDESNVDHHDPHLPLGKPNNNPFNTIRTNNNVTFEQKLKTISKYWSKVFKGDFNIIFNRNKIKENINNFVNYNYIYIKSFIKDKFEEDCLLVFFTLTGNLPCFSNIFIFDEETVEQEFLPF